MNADLETLANVREWSGAIGPNSDPGPLHYDKRHEGDQVVLIGPVGAIKRFEVDEFARLVEAGEWTLVDIDYDDEVYHTPDGEEPW